jgi:uncharacterized membrane protein YtjA (UPF0391 family)/predicted small secreted protein
MLYYAALFFVIALVAALFGFGGIAAGAVEIAKILFFVFLVLFVVSLIAGLMRRGGPRVWRQGDRPMLKWAVIFFLISIAAGFLGFTGIAAGAAGIAKFLFFMFLVLALAVIAFAVVVGKKLFWLLTKEMVMIKRLIGVMLLGAFLGGCNTMQGAGKDIERGGEKIQDTSKDVQRKM